MSKLSTVWVFSDMTSRLPELIGGALTLGEQVNVFALDEAQSSQAFQLGATQVFQLAGKPDDRIIEDYADTIVSTIKQHGDKGLLLLPNTRRGKLLAARLGLDYKQSSLTMQQQLQSNLENLQLNIWFTVVSPSVKRL